MIRSTSPARAASSGSSARRVVLSGPTRTSQSSNSALSPAPAWPAKVISYICDCTRTLLAVWLIRALSLPGGWDRQHPPLGAGKRFGGLPGFATGDSFRTIANPAKKTTPRQPEHRAGTCGPVYRPLREDVTSERLLDAVAVGFSASGGYGPVETTVPPETTDGAMP